MRILFFVLIFIFTNCDGTFSSNNAPLDKEKFIEVYEDVLLLETYYQSKFGIPNSYKYALDKSCEKVFKKHNVKKQEFQKSFEFYAHRPEQLKSINEQIIARLNKNKY